LWQKLGRLAVSQQTRFNLKKLNEVEDKEQYGVEVSSRSAALVNLDAEVNINRTCGGIRENIEVSAKESLDSYELKKHKNELTKNAQNF
jgi:hypothetical protein